MSYYHTLTNKYNFTSKSKSIYFKTVFFPWWYICLARNTDTQVVGADSDVRGVDVSTNGWDDSVLRSLHEGSVDDGLVDGRSMDGGLVDDRILDGGVVDGRSMDGGVVDERSMGSSVVDQRSVGVDQGVGLSLTL